MDTIVLDWDKYYALFSEAHGGDPIVLGNVLVFGDGWRYSLDKEGDEIAPPVEPQEQLSLKTTYWTMRLAILQEEARQRIRQIKTLMQVQEEHSLPLQHTFTIEDTDREGKSIRKATSGSLSLELLSLELEEIVRKVQSAKESLATLEYVSPGARANYTESKRMLLLLEEQLC